MSMPQGQAPDINKLEDAPHRKAGVNVRTPQKGRNGKLPPSSILSGSHIANWYETNVSGRLNQNVSNTIS